MEQSLLFVNRLKTHFSTFAGILWATDGVSLSLERGETFGIVDESGCGKTVTNPSVPLLILEPKGMVYLDLKVRWATKDQHSMSTTSTRNPALRLIWTLSSLKGPNNRVTIPGFYSKIQELTPRNKKPDDILINLKARLRTRGFDDIKVTDHHNILPSRIPINYPVVEIILEFLKEVYGLEPVVFPYIGGSIPNYAFTDMLYILNFVVPHATHDQANSAPNENLDVEEFFLGIRTTTTAFQIFARSL